MGLRHRVATLVFGEPLRDEPQMNRLVPVAPAVLGAVLLLLALGRLAGNPTMSLSLMAVASGSAGIALLVSSLAWRRHQLGLHALHAVLAACIMLGTADTVAVAQATGRPDRASELVLLAVACGVVLVEPAWFTGGMIAVAGGWLALTLVAREIRGLYLVGLLVSLGMAAGARRLRLEGLRELETLRTEAALSVLDPLTGLPDQRGVLLIGTQLMAIANRESNPVGCNTVEVCGYADVVVQHGRVAADALMVHVAGVLRGAVRTTDVVGRWAPNQLAVVAHGQGASIELLTSRIERTLEEDCPLSAAQWTRALRIGHAVREPWDTFDLKATVASAIRSMSPPITFQAPATPPGQRTDAPYEAQRTVREEVEAMAEATPGMVELRKMLEE